jgi:hypothetical protein
LELTAVRSAGDPAAAAKADPQASQAAAGAPLLFITPLPPLAASGQDEAAAAGAGGHWHGWA